MRNRCLALFLGAAFFSPGGARAQDAKKFCDPEDEGGCPKDGPKGDKAPDKPKEVFKETPIAKLDCPPCDDAPVPLVRANFGGSLLGRFALDPYFENGTEHVLEFRSKLHLYVNYQWRENAKVYVGGRFNWWTVGERSESGGFILTSAGRVRHEYEALPDEIYVDLYLKKWLKLRVGNQRFGWGANDFFAPGDVLNPMDFREGPVGDATDPVKIPVFAGTVTVSKSGYSATLAWAPFFTPHKMYAYGSDFAILRANGVIAAPDLTGLVDPSVVDKLQPFVMATQLPEESVSNSTVGLRLEAHKAGFDFGITYVYGWDRVPQAFADPALVAFLVESQKAQPDPARMTGAAVRMAQLVGAGQSLYTAYFSRQHVVAGDVGTTLGSFGLRLDFGGMPTQTMYVTASDGTAVPRRFGMFSYVFGADYSYEDKFFAQLQMLHSFLIGTTSAEPLVLFKESMVNLGFLIRWTLLDGDLEFAVQGMSNLTLQDILLRGTASYRPWRAVRIAAGYNVYQGKYDSQGKPASVGALFDNNDAIFVQARYSF
ncbi:MAG: hypothetical protein HYY84_13000 [Deltaproteobacteria bacterium]|nr:hypothetical protein [Deltaproteobacteria bacterium]